MTQLPPRTFARTLVLCFQLTFLGRSTTRRLPLTLIANLTWYVAAFPPSIPVWRPRYINDFTTLERVQRRATKYILNDFSTNYRRRLISLELLPLMYFLELLDILFFIKCLKFPDPSFPVLNFVSFSNTKTRSSSFSKLIHNPCSSRLSQHSYFSRIARLWNTLPPIDTSVPFSTIKFQVKNFLGSHFLANFNSSLNSMFISCCLSL